MNKKLLFAGIGLILLSVVFFGLHFFIKPPPSTLDIQIRSKPAVMPIAYKVYGNPEALNGRFWLIKLVLTNTGKSNITDLKISYRIPDYIDWTTPSVYKEIIPNQTVIDRFYPKFPPKIINVMNPTPSTVEIKLSYNNGQKTVEEIKKVPFQIRGRNEFIYTDIPPEEIADITDAYDNVELLAAFVTPEDPIIKYFTQQLQQKVLGGTVAGVINSPQEIQRFMNAIYQFETSVGIVYGGTLGLPEKIGNRYSIVQRIRLPREVLTGGAGLCVELSTLFCSIAISAGLNCGIFLTSGHAWPAIIVGETVYPIEATAIGGPGIGGVQPFEKAIEMGMKNLQAWAAGGNKEIGVQIGFLDVNKLQTEGIRPPELADDVSLRKKIDELFAKFEGGAEKEQVLVRGKEREEGRGEVVITRPAPSFQTYTDPTGIFSVSVPSGWQITEYPIPEFPPLVLGVSSPDMFVGIEIYVFDGLYSTEDAIREIAYTIQSVGGQVSYRKVGTKVINGRKFTKYSGVTTFSGSRTVWESYFTVTDMGVIGISAGVTNANFASKKGLINKIINSFRVMQ